jgi:hypothetical protein
MDTADCFFVEMASWRKRVEMASWRKRVAAKHRELSISAEGIRNGSH